MLNDSEKAELQALNDTVDAAVKARTEWLDRKMHEHGVKVGETLYDRYTGEVLGRVHGLYRFWANQKDWRYDTTLETHYTYERSANGTIYNTSCDRRRGASREQVIAAGVEPGFDWTKPMSEACKQTMLECGMSIPDDAFPVVTP